MTDRRRYEALYWELQAIASCELAGPLLRWDRWAPDDAAQLAGYLRDELGPGGLLSAEHARERGASLAAERRQARALLKRLEC